MEKLVIYYNNFFGGWGLKMSFRFWIDELEARLFEEVWLLGIIHQNLCGKSPRISFKSGSSTRLIALGILTHCRFLL